MAFDLNDLNSLDPSEIGSWPFAAKAGVVLILCVATLFGGYWFDTRGQLAELKAAEKEESQLKEQLEMKQRKAASLPAYKQQMADMEESFGTMLRQLPSKTEVDSLLVDITQTGLASGLKFKLFQPSQEQPQEFYAELPIALTVEGKYHQFGEFVTQVAALPRIVTLHDIDLKSSGEEGLLVMQATAKTYRYLTDEEIAANRKSKSGKGR